MIASSAWLGRKPIDRILTTNANAVNHQSMAQQTDLIRGTAKDL
jgi:hypothetical protein